MTEAFLTEPLRARPLHISGIENAILDLLVLVDEGVVEQLGLHKGTMKLVDTDEQRKILGLIGDLEPEIEAGGSCANALRMASSLGSVTSYSSAVAPDANGDAFADGLARHGVKDCVARVDGDTGTSVILVTPDGERTMNTHLGVCREYRSQYVPVEEIRRSRIFYTTGYVWDTPHQIEAIEMALDVARESGVRLAMDLADPFVVERSRDAIERHIALGLDVVFANSAESKGLTGLDPRESAIAIAERVQVAVVTDGSQGAYVASGSVIEHIPAHKVDVVDTTGAGDCFAAGFLHGLARGLPLRTCGELATLLAAETITHLGVKVSDEAHRRAAELAAAAD
jgi:sugar/nucleoside kinase (ribokinase family)